MIQDFFNLPVVENGQFEKLAHGDIHIDTNGTDNSSSANRKVKAELGTDDINILALFNEDNIAPVLIQKDAVTVLVVKGLAGFRFAEQDVGVAVNNGDALDGAPVDKTENLSVVEGRRDALENDTSNACSYEDNNVSENLIIRI